MYMYILDYIYIDNESETIVHDLRKTFLSLFNNEYSKCENNFKMNWDFIWEYIYAEQNISIIDFVQNRILD